MIPYEEVKEVATTALIAWGSDVVVADDLVQEIFLWYLKRPSVQHLMAEADAPVRRIVLNKAAVQILVEETLDADERWGRNTYSSESVKDHLKGRSTNKFLRRIMPQALAHLQRQNPRYYDAIESRFTHGVIPAQGAAAQLVTDAVRSLTRHVNSLVIEGKERDESAVSANSRQGKGGKSDPTAEAAIALIEKGDEPIELANEEDIVTGTTTYRTELANVFDEWMVRPTLDGSRESGARLSVLDGGMLGDRSELYQAEVFPDLFPNEKPMLIENWSQEDREMYCGGDWTPGYLRLVKGGV
ncbi:sigma-K factor [Mycobacterium phage HINdeR]|uniref:Helix-turn-helix DNA binding domain protein n=1 Tax=Mycobacterium phage HINdeR TaxID=1327770 RepID=R4JP25_9CAUD|nr:sigma-K factor [Mycobacterium phage HINdeR]AGK87526.1 hypothetical protein PBI_HINDER_47 [Mycobacterium phage HINdeR]